MTKDHTTLIQDELVQVYNLKSAKWILINKTKGVILAHRNQDHPFHNIPIATKGDVLHDKK